MIDFEQILGQNVQRVHVLRGLRGAGGRCGGGSRFDYDGNCGLRVLHFLDKIVRRLKGRLGGYLLHILANSAGASFFSQVRSMKYIPITK
jgi:hypothetical protein